MKNKSYYAYILASRRNGTLYVGVTGDLQRRIFEHKNNIIEGFTKKYKVHKLVHYEETGNVQAALAREKELKHYTRKAKIDLIESLNPEWNDLEL